MFFESWAEIGRIAVTSVVFYVFLILAVRLGGKRSTSKMNSFDWIVTVAIGAIAGSTILGEQVRLLEGAVAIGALLTLQFLFTKASVSWDRVGTMLQGRPRLLVFEGQYLGEAMRRERVCASEVHAALRESGLTDVTEAWAVVLEADAGLSVIPRQDKSALPLLNDVAGVPEHATG